jgi:hypothetical protein
LRRTARHTRMEIERHAASSTSSTSTPLALSNSATRTAPTHVWLYRVLGTSDMVTSLLQEVHDHLRRGGVLASATKPRRSGKACPYRCVRAWAPSPLPTSPHARPLSTVPAAGSTPRQRPSRGGCVLTRGTKPRRNGRACLYHCVRAVLPPTAPPQARPLPTHPAADTAPRPRPWRALAA